MKKKPIEIGLPDKFEFTHYGHFIRIVRKWFGPKIVYFSLFAILWNSFIFFYIQDLVQQCFFVKAPSTAKITFIPIAHILVGIILTYYVIAGYLNKTVIRVDNENIRVKHRPIPFFFGNKKLDSSGIKQRYSKEKMGYGQDRNNITHYELRAITIDKGDVKLLRLDSPKQALFVEKAIEKFLRIEDKSVKGEVVV
jgi:hypothetical protein